MSETLWTPSIRLRAFTSSAADVLVLELDPVDRLDRHALFRGRHGDQPAAADVSRQGRREQVLHVVSEANPHLEQIGDLALDGRSGLAS